MEEIMILCPKYRGTLIIECPDCNGSGYSSDGGQCEKCCGSGEVECTFCEDSQLQGYISKEQVDSEEDEY